MTQLYIEAFVVGIILTLIGLPICYLSMRIDKDYRPVSTFTWIKIAITFLVAGALTHLIFEWTGMNKRYCTEGHACKKLYK